MKKLAICVSVIFGFCFAGFWSAYGPQESDYQINDIEVLQGLGPFYSLYAVGYDTQTEEGVILRFNYYGWERYGPTQYDQDYVYTNITQDREGRFFIVGYKRSEPDIYRGIVLRCALDIPPYLVVEDKTGNFPNTPFPYADAPPPILSASFYNDKVLITGGYGLILFSDDFGDNWYEPNSRPSPLETRLSDWYISSRWGEGYPYSPPNIITLCADNSGIFARTTDAGNTWEWDTVNATYPITDFGTHYGNVLPLDVAQDFCSMANGCVAKRYPSGWYKTQIPNTGLITYPPEFNKRWFWFHCCHYTPDVDWWSIGGSDGCIMHVPDDLDNWPQYWWERHPANDSFYTINTIEHGLSEPWDPVAHAFGSKGQSLRNDFSGTPEGAVYEFDAQRPNACENFEMVYNALYNGYCMYWDPPENYDSAKVGGYWICPPEDDGDIGWIANAAPVPRTTYFLAWPTGSSLEAGVCAMRRDSMCGPWSNFEWCCTIDKMVDDEATGKSNARRLLYGGNTTWSFWSKDDEIYVAYSADSGKHWTYYRAAQASLGSGNWPAADLDNNHNPAVCWVENIVNGSQVTARIYYRNYSGSVWNSSRILKEETFTGTGYLYPSASVSENGKLHVVYGKVYNGSQGWQLWYGEFPLNDPDAVEWYLLDYQFGEPENLGKLLPTIGTDKYSRPMVIWNRPNSSTFYFAYRDGEGEWYTSTLGFTGTSPNLEVKGVTAYLAYESSTDIWYSTGGTGGFGRPRRISNTAGASAAPVIANNIIVWEEHIEGDYEIYYSYLEDDLTWTTPEKLFGYPYLSDRMPQIAWAYPFAFVDWTQGDLHKVVAFNRKEIKSAEGDGPASMAYDLGNSVPAPILAERSGYATYGIQPGEIVDVGANTLRYEITGLDNEFTWKGKLLFYHESNQSISCRIILNNVQPIIVTIPPHYVMTRTYNIPTPLIFNEELNITIEPLNGSEITLSGVLLYSRPVQTGGGGPQSSGEQNMTTLNLQCTPVIFNKTTEIFYSLSCEADIQLSVYNSIGQLVTIVDKGRKNGNQSLLWTPKDMHGRGLASGIYFLQLKTGDTIAVKKMVIVE